MYPSQLPPQLLPEFSVVQATGLGVTPQRLRANDLDRPFRGARIRKVASAPAVSAVTATNRYERAQQLELSLIRALGSRLVPGQFLSHRSAALLWGAPVPRRLNPELHVTTLASQSIPRIRGVQGHRVRPHRMQFVELERLNVADPATVFATAGGLQLTQLVALGDYFLRANRPGVGRKNVGKPSLASLEDLSTSVAHGRWHGMKRLRKALLLLREDSWSPMESSTRVELLLAGLPEPELNIDLFDECGRFLGCLDMVYRRYKVAVEYQGGQHGERYAEDVERYQSFEAEGWRVIQVTKRLAARTEVMTSRVAAALLERGWDGQG